MAVSFSGIWATVDADLAKVIAEAGHVFTWKGTDYPCVITRAHRGDVPMEGGEWLTYAGKLTTRRALFDTALPEEGDLVTISGQAFVVAKAGYDDLSPVMEIRYENTAEPR